MTGAFTLTDLAALGCALTWVYLTLARGGFWRLRATPVPAGAPPARHVVAVIPARDEADGIGAAVGSLLTQDYPGTLEVVVIDDGSRDGTADVARAAAAACGAPARLTVLTGLPLAAGWTGKLWAQSQGVARALDRAPDFLLLTDADIVHEPGNVADLVARAEAHGHDLVSYLVLLPVESAAERELLPAFVYFFLMLYPPRWIADPRRATAGAAGGCMLVRPAALARIGGLASMASALIDDCTLAARVKASGGRPWLGLTRTARSLRRYPRAAEIGRMISRTAFYQLRHSYVLLAGTIAGLALTYLAPPLLVLAGDPLARGLGALAFGLMALTYAPTLHYLGLSRWRALLLPAVAVYYAGATLHSAWRYRTGRGGEWKGRVQDRAAP